MLTINGRSNAGSLANVDNDTSEQQKAKKSIKFQQVTFFEVSNDTGV